MWDDTSDDIHAEDKEPRVDPVTGEWHLSEWDVECITIGAGVLGCGGGGSITVGRLRTLKVMREGKDIRVISPSRYMTLYSYRQQRHLARHRLNIASTPKCRIRWRPKCHSLTHEAGWTIDFFSKPIDALHWLLVLWSIHFLGMLGCVEITAEQSCVNGTFPLYDKIPHKPETRLTNDPC